MADRSVGSYGTLHDMSDCPERELGKVGISGVTLVGGKIPVEANLAGVTVELGSVTVNGSYPTLRCLSTDTEPTVNNDSSALVKCQLLWIVDTDIWKYWSGTAWVVKN